MSDYLTRGVDTPGDGVGGAWCVGEGFYERAEGREVVGRCRGVSRWGADTHEQEQRGEGQERSANRCCEHEDCFSHAYVPFYFGRANMLRKELSKPVGEGTSSK